MHNITVVYNKEMKMSDLIDSDYFLLPLLNHLNIPLGFGEKSIEAVCKANGFDADCFIFLADYISQKEIINIEEQFYKLPLEPFLYYLKRTHSYFLDQRLPNIRRKLEHIFTDSDADLRKLVFDFFDKYCEEVKEHMIYEDDVVFPYIQSLLDKSRKKEYSIMMFEERHNDIESKMNDLKQILLKYVDGSKNQSLMVHILMEVYSSAEELEMHTFIEDELVIPRVKAMEKL